uniref:Uncharacterized protein n=1 Tax=Anopheles culicifacies TaxID=139723 RepID=A0A182MVA6_9DIPT
MMNMIECALFRKLEPACELRLRELLLTDACDFIEFCCDSSDERRERDFALALLALEALTLVATGGWLRLVLILLQFTTDPFVAVGSKPPPDAGVALVALPLLALLDRNSELRRRLPVGRAALSAPKIV